MEFHTWVHVEHNRRDPRGAGYLEAEETVRIGEPEPFGKPPEFWGRLWTS